MYLAPSRASLSLSTLASHSLSSGQDLHSEWMSLDCHEKAAEKGATQQILNEYFVYTTYMFGGVHCPPNEGLVEFEALCVEFVSLPPGSSYWGGLRLRHTS